MIYRPTQRQILYSLAVIIMVITSILWSVGIVALVIGVVASYLLLRRSFVKAPFASGLFLFISSLIFYCLSLVIFSLGAWLFVHTATLTSVLVVTTIAHLGTLALLRPRKQPIPTIPLFSRSDAIASICTMALILLILLPIGLRASHGLGGDAILGLIDGNVDDGAHLAIINDRVQYDRPILTKTPFAESIRTGQVDNGSYPVGWHAANAAIAKAIFPGIKVGAETLHFYIASKLFWFMILGYAFFHSGITFVFAFAKKLKRGPLLPFAVSLLCLFAIYFLIDQFRLGFYSFIPQMLGILLLAYSLWSFASTVSGRGINQHTVAYALLPLIVFGFGGSLSWTLLLPATCIPVILVVVQSLRARNINLKTLLSGVFRLAPIAVGSAVALAALVYLMRIASHTGMHVGFIDSINTYGLISVYNQSFLAFIGLGLIGLVVFAHSLQDKNAAKNIDGGAILATALLIEAALIYIVQLSTVEVSTYYYFKSLNAFFILAIPLAIAGVTLLVGKYLRQPVLYVALFVLTLLYIGFPAGNSPIVSYLKGEQSLDKSATRLVMQTLSAPVTNDSLHAHTLFFDPMQPRQTDIANVLMRSIPLYDECFARIRPSFTDGTKEKDIMEIISRECKESNLRIYSPHQETQNFMSSAELMRVPKSLDFRTLPR